MNLFENMVWSERYRPSTIAECILPAETKSMVTEFIKTNNVPNLLFHGTAGVGKTTLAKAMANELEADLMFINGSKDNGIDVLRTKIQQFASTVSLTGNKKMVVIDESDYLNPNSTQPAFRAFLEEFTSCIFIFTCNYKNRLIDPLLSRLTTVDFTITKDERASMAGQMLKRSCSILDENGIEYDKKVLASLITRHFPDFRKTISELQRYSTKGIIDSGILSKIGNASAKELFDSIKSKNFANVRQIIANNSYAPTEFFRMFYDNCSQLVTPNTIPQLILLIGEYQFRAAHSVDQEINQMAFVLEVLKSCQFAE